MKRDDSFNIQVAGDETQEPALNPEVRPHLFLHVSWGYVVLFEFV
jgi:hypothetical protein